MIGNTYINENGSIALPSEENIRDFGNLKLRNPNLKLLICLSPHNRLMSLLAANEKLRKNFLNDVVDYLIKYNLDGFGRHF